MKLKQPTSIGQPVSRKPYPASAVHVEKAVKVLQLIGFKISLTFCYLYPLYYTVNLYFIHILYAFVYFLFFRL